MRKKFLTILVTLTASIGLVGVSIPFIGSLRPSAKATNEDQVFVKISTLKAGEAFEFEYRWYRVFVLNNPLRAFRIPIHYKLGYGFPDPTWERPFIQCLNFIFKNGQFYCNDKEFLSDYFDMARWDQDGKSIGESWLPDLETMPMHNNGQYLVFGSSN